LRERNDESEQKYMNKVLATVLLAAALGTSAVVAQAMPLVNGRAQDNLVVPVADGCWLGWHRNPSGGCSRDRYGLLGSGIEYVPGPYYRTGPAVCGGRGVYRVCNIFGYCWWVCN